MNSVKVLNQLYILGIVLTSQNIFRLRPRILSIPARRRRRRPRPCLHWPQCCRPFSMLSSSYLSAVCLLFSCLITFSCLFTFRLFVYFQLFVYFSAVCLLFCLYLKTFSDFVHGSCPHSPALPLDAMYLWTALVPSETACLESSPGRISLTAVWKKRNKGGKRGKK